MVNRLRFSYGFRKRPVIPLFVDYFVKHNMRKYLTDITADISKLQENLQILLIFDLTFVLY